MNLGDDDKHNVDQDSSEMLDGTDKKSEEYIKLENDYKELYNRFLRIAADFDNYKKRISREKTDIADFGNEGLIKELLTVLDNLELAISHSDPEADIRSIIDGIRLVHNQLFGILGIYGLKVVDSSKGAEFDPMYHQAVERVETEELTPGLILEEMVRGYLLKDRLLRPASVTVSTDIIDEVSYSNDSNEEDTLQKNGDQNSDDDGLNITNEDLD